MQLYAIMHESELSSGEDGLILRENTYLGNAFFRGEGELLGSDKRVMHTFDSEDPKPLAKLRQSPRVFASFHRCSQD